MSNAKNISLRKEPFGKDYRLSTCTDCRYGLFKGQEYVWTKRGLVHTKCNERNLSETENTT